MADPEDTQDLSSVDAEDDFDRRMIQHARDERRLQDALSGSARVQAFRKARAPRLGLTVANVEQNNARTHGALEANAHAHVQLASPPSSSGSTRSDPAIHAPAAWGRKSRSNRSWMRTITCEELLQTTPPPAHDAAKGLRDDQTEWDLTFELNEASIIASTPYIPRNTMLDDIRQREAAAGPAAALPEKGGPVRHRREDSQDLLRRLARVSNTPSPRRTEPPRPQTAPASQLPSSSQTLSRKEPQPPASTENHGPDVEEPPLPEASSKALTSAPATGSQQQEQKKSPAEPEAPQASAPEEEPEDVDATPVPSERARLVPKTPVVTGAWVDTPGPRTTQKHISIAPPPSSSPKKGSPRRSKSPIKSTTTRVHKVIAETTLAASRPQLPSSALQALVQEAKANGRRQSADLGDSTINSLEDLVSPEGDMDEDTLQGLQLPTITPRNEAERQRQQELQHLHRMNDRLRAARTSIRDASRGMKRVEDRVEHGEEVEGGAKAGLCECPCAVKGHAFSLRSTLPSLFWDPTLKTKRRGTSWRTLGGLTTLSILMLLLFTWWIGEEIACELYCHHAYTNFSPHKYSVNPNAPQFPFVLPTLLWRALFWWIPAGSAASWAGRSIFTAHNAAAMQQSASSTAAWAARSQIAEDVVWEQSMLRDEVL
ncbi:hypothetical protein BDU57DRAFT_27610 [Ampelomyces quisqualis]|uniref:Uncharacterized protein n=1 Tax=Ampelomyces quisqualis TaxID=50730 RepID=A0A6A5R4G4_AMPQU|nr:hypothetical protein BDU57DRAFT_27610 [Ampelomyces quisqualis]